MYKMYKTLKTKQQVSSRGILKAWIFKNKNATVLQLIIKKKSVATAETMMVAVSM